MLTYVNSKTIDNKLYTALRDDIDPKIQVIECEGVQKPCRIKDVWFSDDKIKALFS